MGNTVLVSNDFHSLLSKQQREILESYMLHESITWTTVLSKVYPTIKDQEFLVNLIKNHKNGTNAPVTLASKTQETYNRPKINVTPEEMKPAALPSFVNTDAKRTLYMTFIQAMMPAPIETQTPKAAAINNTDGNKYKSATWAQLYLTPTRKDNCICTKGTSISSYFSNPKKAVHTLFNWFKADVKDSDLNAINYIESFKQPMELAESIRRACYTRGITLKRGTKEFVDVFACTEPEDNPTLIVAEAKVHETHEKDEMGTPQDEQFTVLLLLYQTEPHLCLPFSNTYMNLHLGNMIRKKDYKKSETIEKYMKNNVNHKLVPIQNGPPGKHTIERQLQLKAY